MKVTANLTVDIEAMHYPLSVLNDLLYRLIDELSAIESSYGDDDDLFPIQSELRYEEGDTGRMLVNITKS